MSKDQKTKKKKNVETVENWKEYFNENFEFIEISIKYARDVKYMIERVIKYLGNDFQDNLYKNGL